MPLDDPSPAQRARKHRRRWASAIVGVLVSALFTWLAVRHVDAAAVSAAWAAVHWEWAALYVLAAIGVQGLRMGRWSLLLWWLGERQLRHSLAVGAVGLAAVFFLPARLGELVRPVLVARTKGVRVAHAAATIVVERMLDGMLVGLMLVGAGLFAGDDATRGSMLRATGSLVGGGFLAVGAAIWVAALFADRWREPLIHRLRRVPRLADSADSTITRFRAGLLSLGRPAHATSYSALSAAMWILNALSLLLLFRAFDLELPLAAAFVVLGVQAVGILAPSAPTSLGTFHFAVVWALGSYGQSESLALGFATLYHLGQIAANLAVGLGGLAAGGVRMRELTARVRLPETPRPP